MSVAISIIVPFYNSSKYIERCVASLCNQSIKDKLELVFVDDCSTDGSSEIVTRALADYAFYGPVQLIRHEENMGAAKARITGINAAKGDYVLFCDSDDWQEPDMCERLLTKAEKDTADIVICNYRSVYESSHEVHEYNCCRETDDYLKELLLCRVTGSLCNKLIHRSILADPSFLYPEKTFSEDYVYCVQSLLRARKISFVNATLYNYYHHSGSVIKTTSEEKLISNYLENVANMSLVIRVLKNSEKLEKYSNEIIVMKLAAKNMIKGKTGNSKFYRLWRTVYPELNGEVRKSKLIPFRVRFVYYLTLIRVYPLFAKARAN